ncbi:MAG: DUF1800 family protein [Planctomycetota bacterium]
MRGSCKSIFTWLELLPAFVFVWVIVIDTSAAPPVFEYARSEMRHSDSSTNSFLAIRLNESGPRSIETRIPRNGETVIIFVFDQPLQDVGSITSTHGAIQSVSGVRSAFPDTVAVHLLDLPNGEYVTVSLSDIQSTGGEILPSAVATVGMLRGDVNGNRLVEFADARLIASANRQDVTQNNNFIFDLNLNRVLEFADARLAALANRTVLANTPPSITALTDQFLTSGSLSTSQAFTIDDFSTPAEDLFVTATSSNSAVLPDSNILIDGTGASRMITVQPVAGVEGGSTVTVTVSDGSLSASETFTVEVSENTPPTAFLDLTNFLGQVPLTVDFDASRSVDNETAIVNFAIDTGDGGFSNEAVFTHTYNTPGTYPVTVTVIDTGGLASSIESTITVADGNFDVNAQPSVTDASRFLWQAAFGPTASDIAAVRSRGYEGWIDDQMALSPTLLTQALFDLASTRNGAGQVFDQRYSWANIAVEADDQLRQRVAWALIQILVMNNDQDSAGPIPSRNYYNYMVENAFGNYRDLLSDVTFSFSMGNYLTYRDNARANLSQGTVPDENYAREIMQLFSIGLFELNLDGTLKLDAQGNPIPTYTNEDIVQFARVFTGLRTSNIGGNFQIRTGNPMRMDANIHEFGSKQLLNYPGAVNGGFIPARNASEANGIADINFAIDNVFNHPSTPPFISHLLIQRLVTSNPTPGYIERVASVFVDDGTGTRGNLGAVVKAILLDPEARDRTYSSNPYFGKIIEPFLLKWSLYRVLDRLDRPTQPFGLRVDQFQFGEIDLFGQSYMTSPSVFNFYLPDYTIPNGGLDLRSLDAPELQIINEITVFSGLNNHRQVSIARGGSSESNVYDQLRALIPANNVTNNTALIDAIDELLMYGTMSPEMKQILLTVAPRISNQTERVRAMVYMTIASPEFQLVN